MISYHCSGQHEGTLSPGSIEIPDHENTGPRAAASGAAFAPEWHRVGAILPGAILLLIEKLCVPRLEPAVYSNAKTLRLVAKKIGSGSSVTEGFHAPAGNRHAAPASRAPEFPRPAIS